MVSCAPFVRHHPAFVSAPKDQRTFAKSTRICRLCGCIKDDSHPSLTPNLVMSASDKNLYVPSKLQLPRPDFSVDNNNEDLELWTVRLPTNVPVSSLNDVEIDLNSKTGSFQVGEQEYKIMLGDSVENEFFRALVPAEDDESDDSDSENDDDSDSRSEKQKFLKPSASPFTRHWNVVTAVPILSETQLAPREGPPPVGKMRHAYSHVPQRTGLKRRFMPMGVKVESSTTKPTIGSVASASDESEKADSNKSKSLKREAIAITTPPNRSLSNEQEQDQDTDKAKSRSDKKARKSEKKAAKKGKKEAKKAKKEKRKSK